jgi:hypothetical protein
MALMSPAPKKTPVKQPNTGLKVDYANIKTNV